MSGRLPGRAIFFLALCGALAAQPLRAQTNPAVPAELEMTPEQIEFQKKLGAATAKAQQDPAVQAAYQKMIRTMRELDELLYGKIKQIDPSLKEHIDKLLSAKYPDSGK